MIKLLCFIDFSNLTGQLKGLNRRPNMASLPEHIANPAEGRFIINRRVYAALPHENGEGVQRFYTWMRSQGYQVITKRAKRLPDGRLKCDMDGEMMLDCMEMSFDVKPDVVTLVTGDGDYAVLADKLRTRGIVVECASLHDALAQELKLASNSHIDLASWLDTCDAYDANAPLPAVGNVNIFDAFI